MKTKICPKCFSGLPEVANYCPVCGEKLIEIEEGTLYCDGMETADAQLKSKAIMVDDLREINPKRIEGK